MCILLAYEIRDLGYLPLGCNPRLAPWRPSTDKGQLGVHQGALPGQEAEGELWINNDSLALGLELWIPQAGGRSVSLTICPTA